MFSETRYLVTVFNLVATVMAWLLVYAVLNDLAHPDCLSPGPTRADYADLVMTLMMALSATAPLILSCVRFRWAKALWQEAQFNLAWVFCAAAVHQIIFERLILAKPVDYGVHVFHIIILGMAILGSLSASATRKYLELHP